jgi:hypothetical protein
VVLGSLQLLEGGRDCRYENDWGSMVCGKFVYSMDN